MLAYIRLTRPLNLAIIALTMWLMRHYVLRPAVEVNGLELQMSGIEFLLLVLAAVLMAAAGNIINDYFDQRIDRINRPNRIIVGRHVKRRVAMALHQVLNLLGMAVAVYVSWRVGLLELAVIFFFTAGLLWFYSTNFKRMLLVGNIVVAFLTGLVPLLVGLYEIPLLIRKYGDQVAEYFRIHRPNTDPTEYFAYMFYFILGFAIFAFLLNLIREIQKDMADVQGDSAIRSQTVPIVWGMDKAKTLVAVLTASGIVAVVVIQQKFLSAWEVLAYAGACVLLPMLLSGILTLRAKTARDHVLASNVMKVAMLGGLLYSIVHNFIYFA